MVVQIFSRIVLAAFLLAALGGCLPQGQPLIAERSPIIDDDPLRPGRGGVYTVREGDTLYAIAWRFELDFDGLARANGLREPYTLRPGQQIRLVTQLARGERAVAAAPRPAAPARKAEPAASKPQRAAPDPASDAWVWPLSQPPLAEFGRGNKGIDFGLGGARQARVRAAAGGEVLYAGNGIGGYERLIILRHGASLLSAYSFDGAARVREKQTVKAGAGIADIRNRGRTKQSLHFELRRDGVPINPRSVLR